MIPVQINLPNVHAGDTWEGVSFGPALVNGVQPPLALASCRLYFRDANTKTLAYGFKSVATVGFGTITIANAATWSVSIAAQILPLVAGTYLWDFEITDVAGTVITPCSGILIVTQDVTHD